MSCFPEVLFQLAAEVIGIREIIVVVNPDRGIVFHRKSLSLTILRLCHQNKEIFREIQVSSMEPDSFLTKWHLLHFTACFLPLTVNSGTSFSISCMMTTSKKKGGRA